MSPVDQPFDGFPPPEMHVSTCKLHVPHAKLHMPKTITVNNTHQLTAQMHHTQSFFTPDSGADCTVVGNNWRIADIDPIQKANIVGFDKDHARKTNLPTVTAITLVEHPNGNKCVLHGNELVCNSNGPNTLLGHCFQLQDAGCAFDLTHKHQLGVDMQPGTCSWCPPDEEGTLLPLHAINTLPAYPHRQPTEAETQDTSVPVIEITRPGTWTPQAFNSNGDDNICDINETQE